MQTTGSIAECFAVQMMKTEEEVDVLKGLPDDIEPKLAILLHTYKAVFDNPVGLPPQRK